ncbi:MAG: YkvA family protein [Rhodobacteraceae bacterium]|nr:YkvA family protein [Paracoccaceae bacterium]
MGTAKTSNDDSVAADAAHVIDPKYGQHYSDAGFNTKLTGFAGVIGKGVTLHALKLYYCMADERTPLKHKSAIVASLGYLILPIDLIPDVLVGLGFTDDATVLAGLIAMLGNTISSEHVERARKRANELFGKDAESEGTPES